MCTASWSPAPGGYQLFFNRDERRTRLEALPPRLEEEQGVPYLAPRDADAGGTWLAVNAFGLTVCLLNLYQAEAALPSRDGKTSRGLLVRSLAAAKDRRQAATLLAERDLGAFMPFTLVLAEAEGRVGTFAWDGREPGPWQQAAPPIVSSGYDVAGAIEARRRLFASLGTAESPSYADLHSFHCSHEPEKGAYSPCMHRSDAKTVSLCAVRVGAERVELAYAPGSPCRTPLGSPLELARLPS